MRFGDGEGSRFSKEGRDSFEFDQTLLKFEREADELERIDPTDFTELYGTANVEADLAYVKDMEALFKREQTTQEKNLQRISNAFETILFDRIELDDWFGPKTMTLASSRYDDIKNGIDVIAEIGEEDSNAVSHLGLAVDITYSTHLEKKFDRIRQEILSRKLSTIKYFQSSEQSFMGQLSNVPRVVIGVQKEAIGELMQLTLGKKRKELAAHPVQHQILSEIRLQLHTFTEFAQKQKAGNVIVQRLEHAADLIDGIIEDKAQGKKSNDFKKDRVYQEIASQLASKFK